MRVGSTVFHAVDMMAALKVASMDETLAGWMVDQRVFWLDEWKVL